LLGLESSIKHSQIPFNQLTVEKEIGEGSYGKVYLGKWSQASVALKFCQTKRDVANLFQELQVLMYVTPLSLSLSYDFTISFERERDYF
jgi:predicted Ser/Thr protein kinase